jgi:hypothetical protein
VKRAIQVFNEYRHFPPVVKPKIAARLQNFSIYSLLPKDSARLYEDFFGVIICFRVGLFAP